MSASKTTNDFDSVFEEKSSRLVWIVPSVLLHVVVVAIWVFSPENEPRSREERKLVIKSDQAQQLKQHVEDANLLELRTELSELQQIKAAMVGIRKQKLDELLAFEEELHAQLPDDIRQAVQAITKAQTGVVAKLKKAQAAVEQYEKDIATIQPMAVVEKLASLQEQAGQVKAKRRAMYDALEEGHLELERVGQLVVRAQTVLEWVQDETVLADWREFEAKQKQAIELYAGKANEVRQGFKTYNEAVDEMAGQAKSHAEFLVSRKEREVKDTQNYDKKKRECETRIAEWTEKIIDLKALIAKYAADEPRLKTEYEQLKQQVARMPTRTKEERSAKNTKNAELKRCKSSWERVRRGRERKQGDLKRTERNKTSREALLARLKPYQMSRGDQSRIDKINDALATLRQPITGKSKLIAEAVAAQNEARTAASAAWTTLAEMIARQSQQTQAE